MARTIAQLDTTGRGRIVLYLEICGIGVFGTTATAPAESWFDDYTEVHPWLQHRGIAIEEQIDYLESTCEVSRLTVQLADLGGDLTALWQDWQARSFTRLSASITATAVVLPVLDASKLPAAPGIAYLGQEAVYYTVRDLGANELQGCTRGYRNTVARAYTVDHDATPPRRPVVADGPVSQALAGHRLRLYAAVRETDGTTGATTVLWRGWTTDECRVGEGRWLLVGEPITEVLKRNVAVGLPRSDLLPGYWYSGGGEGTASTVRLVEYDLGVAGFGEDSTVALVALTSGWRPSPAALAATWNDDAATACTAAGFAEAPQLVLTPDLDGWRVVWPASAGMIYAVVVREGDPLWALGFEPGTYQGELATRFEVEAQGEPRALVADLAYDDPDQDLTLAHAQGWERFTAGLYAQVKGWPYGQVKAVAETLDSFGAPTGGGTVTFYAGRFDLAYARVGHLAVEDADDLVLAHVLVLGTGLEPLTLTEAAQRLLFLTAGQPEPDSWVAAGLQAEDCDWTELEAACRGLPEELLYVHLVAGEELSVQEALGQLGALAICPRLTTGAKLGWTRIETPTPASVSGAITVDASCWSLPGAPHTEANLSGAARITAVRVDHSYDYRDGSWPRHLSVNWNDGFSELGRQRQISYSARGLGAGIVRPRPISGDEIEAALQVQLTATHYGLLGHTAPPVAVRCTWISRQLKCGDIVEVTHPTIPDLAVGTVGVTGRLALVVGRRHPVTEGGDDVLTLRFPPELLAGGIAPAAVADGWNAGQLELTISDDTRFNQAGETDLTWFEAGMPVRIVTRDSTAMTEWTATIDYVAAGVIALTADPFGGAFPTSVYVFFDDWDSANATQQSWGYQGDANDYSLGAADDAQEWAV